MAYAVEMKGITKTFPGVVANKEVSLTVPWGSIHGLIGENGAGKTTLMKVLYGMYRQMRAKFSSTGSPLLFVDRRTPLLMALGWFISTLHWFLRLM